MGKLRQTARAGLRSVSEKTHNNASRERSRVKTLRAAFLQLQRSLPAVPPDTKLSKLDVLVLATAYICHLTRSLQEIKFCRTDTDVHRSQAKFNQISHENEKTAKVAEGIRSPCSSCCTCNFFPKHHTFGRLTFGSHNTDLAAAKNLLNSFESGSASLGPNVCFTETSEKESCFKKHTLQSNCSFSNIRYMEKGTQQYKEELVATMPSPEPLLSMDKMLMKVGCSKSLDTKMAASLHPVKKWPMRSRLYDSILNKTTKKAVTFTRSPSSS